MTDPIRHRRVRAQPVPHGSLPNWVLVLFGFCALAIATAAHAVF